MFLTDNILSSAHNISTFTRLETLILHNIEAKHVKPILHYALSLSKLYSLTINPINIVQQSNFIYRQIFKLPVLKYCKISLKTSSTSQSLRATNNEHSGIEILIIENTPRSNKHDRKRPYMEKYDEIHGPVLRSVYLRVVYGETRRYMEKKNGRLRSYTETYTIVYRRIRSP